MHRRRPRNLSRLATKLAVALFVVAPAAAGSARAAAAELTPAAPTAPADDAAGREAVAFFETSVRPLLADNCYACHGPDKQKGGLRLDSRAGMLRGGEVGPALVPGQPGESRIVTAIGYEDPDLRMPPKKRLTAEQVKTLTRWVAMGAPWPGDTGDHADSNAPAAPVRPDARPVTDADRLHWSFQPVREPAAPAVSAPAWVANPIDAFVLAKLDARGLKPNPPAEKRELLRRAAFDLTGLPPTPEEYEAFLNDDAPDAWPRAIDRLLASPRYGERWARHWLDVVRYAQTEGYERDAEKPYAWRYRDYVIGAFNADKPYDQFVREQLAGDELDAVTDETLIATGFYRLGVVDDEPDDKAAAEYDYFDDSLRTIGAAFLGLTVGCARCHDHKFDPVPQADYYRLLAFVRNVRMHERPRYTRDSATYVPVGGDAARAQVDAWYAQREAEVAPLRQKIEAITGPARAELIRQGVAEPDEERVVKALAPAQAGEHAGLVQQMREIERREPPFADWALAVRERGAERTKTHVLVRGSAASPGAEVRPAFLEVLGGGEPTIAPRPGGATSTGLRRALAEWLVRPAHPLTARVMVNRVWQHHFGGRGIVPTPDDFGKTGVAPTHPELLDWLAARFVAGGWSVKQLHRLILTSNAYRMSSRAGADHAAAAAADPGNHLLWRQNMRRLEAEAIRDSVLAVCGTLDTTTGGRGFFPWLGREAIASGSRPGDGWGVSPPAERNRRSIYAYLKRSTLVPMLETFDFNNTAMPSGERASTVVSPQALMLLNDDFMHEQADALARRLTADAPRDRRRQLTLAYARALGRTPTADELDVADGYVGRQSGAFASAAHLMTFRPQVPGALFTGYLKLLGDADLLAGPRTGWRYGRGVWGGAYENIVNVDPARGPFALAEAQTFADGVVDARVRLHPGAELGGLIVRGEAAADASTHLGYDVVLDAPGGAVLLRKHLPDKVVTLASAPLQVRAGYWYSLRVSATGPRVTVWLDGGSSPALDVTDPDPLLAAGHVGARVWGAAMDVDRLTVTTPDGATTPIAEGLDEPGRAERQGLASFCLVLLNLNEFVYVD
jgi:mono/diheme cytochrome c family protein